MHIVVVAAKGARRSVGKELMLLGNLTPSLAGASHPYAAFRLPSSYFNTS